MRRGLYLLLFASLSFAQTTQTPRQALIEMIKAPTEQQLDRHLPKVMLQALAKLPPDAQQKRQETTMMPGTFLAMMNVKTYDSGPIFAELTDQRDKSKIELTMERDEMNGDGDAMEIGIRTYKDGVPQEMLPVPFRVLVNMRMEDGVWKLTRIGASASMPLDDPKFANDMVKDIEEALVKQAQAANAKPTNIPPDRRVLPALRMLATAELTYAINYPQVGYTCRLNDLGGTLNGRSADEHGAQLIDPALASGHKNGYQFEVTGCSATPATKFQILATPMQKGVGWPAYCIDETGTLKSIAEMNAKYCAEAGAPSNEK